MAKSSFEAKAHKLIDWMGKISTTNLRIFVTLGIVIWTAATYFRSDTWVPSSGWLTFLCVYAGLDIGQYGIKRFSFRQGSPTDVAMNGTAPTDDDAGSTASTDVQEAATTTITKG